ncbi:hypothetical protein GCM10027093_12770 [Paraburkholderia jirisanensis]
MFSVDTEKPIFGLPPLPAAGAAAGAEAGALAIAAALALASLAAVLPDDDSFFEQPLNAAAAHSSNVAPVDAPRVVHRSNLAVFQAMSVSSRSSYMRRAGRFRCGG